VPCSFYVSPASRWFLVPNQPPAIKQCYFSLIINQHQPPTKQTSYRLLGRSSSTCVATFSGQLLLVPTTNYSFVPYSQGVVAPTSSRVLPARPHHRGASSPTLPSAVCHTPLPLSPTRAALPSYLGVAPHTHALYPYTWCQQFGKRAWRVGWLAEFGDFASLMGWKGG
jgi:hypothetical protein